jgi:hypothetical protein
MLWLLGELLKKMWQLCFAQNYKKARVGNRGVSEFKD